MATVYINNRIRLSKNGLQVQDYNKTWIDLHCQQGRLDGACAVYSTTMALLCLGVLSEEDIDYSPDRRTLKGKFLHHLFEEQGLIRDGYALKTIGSEIREYIENVKVERHFKPETIIPNLVADLKDDKPCILHVYNDVHDFHHAIFAVGLEYDENERPKKIFCLDPGYACSKTAYWNCIVELNNDENPSWYITEDTTLKVNIYDTLALELI